MLHLIKRHSPSSVRAATKAAIDTCRVAAVCGNKSDAIWIMRLEGYHSLKQPILFENFDATEEVAAFYLFAVAKIEFGAESGYNNRRNQIPPFDRSINDTNRPIYNTTD